MAKRSKVRFLANMELEIVNEEGEVREQLFKSGSYTSVERVVTDGEWMDIIFENGDIIEGVQANLIEVFGAPIEQMEKAEDINVTMAREQLNESERLSEDDM